MNILILGSESKIGKYIASELKGTNVNIYRWSRHGLGKYLDNQWVEAKQNASIKESLFISCPKVIINCVGSYSKNTKKQVDANINFAYDLVRNIVNYNKCKEDKIEIINLSSLAVYDLYRAKCLFGKYTLYSSTKIANEKILESITLNDKKVNITHLRISTVIGNKGNFRKNLKFMLLILPIKACTEKLIIPYIDIREAGLLISNCIKRITDGHLQKNEIINITNYITLKAVYEKLSKNTIFRIIIKLKLQLNEINLENMIVKKLLYYIPSKPFSIDKKYYIKKLGEGKMHELYESFDI